MKAYPSYLKTYEGQGVLYELGLAYYLEAEEEKDQKLAGPNYDKAIIQFDKLAALEGDLADQAAQTSMDIKSKRLDTKAELTTFDEFYMKAMAERKKVIETLNKLDQNAGKIAKAPNDDTLKAERKKIDAERQRHLKAVIKALTKADRAGQFGHAGSQDR